MMMVVVRMFVMVFMGDPGSIGGGQKGAKNKRQ
jgi:hypothetical protein